jgi:adenine deaminase
LHLSAIFVTLENNSGTTPVKRKKGSYTMFPFNAHNRQLLETALGNEPADLVIKDGILADVYTGRMIPHRSVAVSGKWIAYVGPDADYAIGEKTHAIEAEGRVISPGFIDPHTHLANYCDISDFLKYAIPGGTTTYITEVESYCFALGAEGFRAFLDQVRNRPVKFFCLIPPMVTTSPAAAPLFITTQEAGNLLNDELVIGLGEAYWQNAILTPDNRILELIQETVKRGKSVQGHAAGATDRKLAAYAAAGAVSCHEAISPEDVLARLEMGYGVMIREGHIRRDLEIILPLRGKIDLHRCALSTDGTDPDLLLSRGYFSDVVQKAVDMGLEPLEAIRMATLNPAEHLGLDHLVGGISPGRFADILLLPEPGTMTPDLVISEGQIVAEGGKTLIPLPKISHPDQLRKTVRIPYVDPEQLTVPLSSCSMKGKVRTMDIQANGLVAREGMARAPSAKGNVLPDPTNDLLKTVVVERASGRGKHFVGFARGWGLKQGAIASSLAWDASAIVAVGIDDLDLATAINRVIELQGGAVLALDGAIKIDIPFPIAGYISDLKIEDLASALAALQHALEDLGSNLQRAHLTLVTMTSAAIPFIRITEEGYFRFRENDYVGI